MFEYLKVVQSLVSDFIDFKISYIPREENVQADILFKVASADFPNKPDKYYLKSSNHRASRLRLESLQFNDFKWGAG